MGKYVIRVDSEKILEALGLKEVKLVGVRVDEKVRGCVEVSLSDEGATSPHSSYATYYREFRAISQAVSSTMDLNEILDLIVKHLKETMRVKGCTIRLLDKAKRRLELAAAVGLSKAYLAKGPVGSEQSAEALDTGKAVIVLDATKDKKVQYPIEASREGIVSMLTVPIRVRGAVIGIVRLYSATKRRFLKDEVEFVAAVAEQGGLAIENARLIDQVRGDFQTLMEDTWRWFEQAYPPLRA